MSALANPVDDLGEPTQTVTYPISIDYVKQWTLVRALSEAVANAIDADPYGFSVSYDDVAQEMIIEDNADGGIGVEAMIFGWSSKTDRKDVIGQFGEGLKIATIRAVSDPTVRYMLIDSVGMKIVPSIVDYASMSTLSIPQKSKKAPKVLAWNLFPSDRTQGTVLRIGVSRDVYEQVSTRFRHITKPGYVAPTFNGNLLVDEPGDIYIGGVYINHVAGLLFGYDFSFDAAKGFQNRDRTMVDEYRLRWAIAAVCAEVDDKDILAEVVKAMLEGRLADAEKGFLRANVRSVRMIKAWKEAGEKALGGPSESFFYRKDAGDAEKALSLGDANMTELTPNGLSEHEFQTLMNLIHVKPAKTASERDVKEEVTWVKGKLSPDEQSRLDNTVATLRKFFTDAAIGKVRVYEDISSSAAIQHCQTLGFYQPTTGLIAIKRSRLATDDSAWDTLYHEAAHRIAHKNILSVLPSYEYADRTRGFESTLVQMGTIIARHYTMGAELPKSQEDRVPVPLTWQSALPDCMVYSFSRNQKLDAQYPKISKESIYGDRVRALMMTAFEQWVKDNNGGKKVGATTAFQKATFITAASLNKITKNVTAQTVDFEHLKDMGEVLNVNPAVLWWATIGVCAPLLNRKATSKNRKIVGKRKDHADASFAYVRADADIALYADDLIAIRDGKAGAHWYGTDWTYPIEAILAAEEAKWDADDLARNLKAVSRPSANDASYAWKALVASKA